MTLTEACPQLVDIEILREAGSLIRNLDMQHSAALFPRDMDLARPVWICMFGGGGTPRGRGIREADGRGDRGPGCRYTEDVRRACAAKEVCGEDVSTFVTISIGVAVCRGEIDLSKVMRHRRPGAVRGQTPRSKPRRQSGRPDGFHRSPVCERTISGLSVRLAGVAPNSVHTSLRNGAHWK